MSTYKPASKGPFSFVSLVVLELIFNTKKLLIMEAVDVRSDRKRHYEGSIIWVVVGIAWGNAAFAYVASIIGTTLGIFTLSVDLLTLFANQITRSTFF